VRRGDYAVSCRKRAGLSIDNICGLKNII